MMPAAELAEAILVAGGAVTVSRRIDEMQAPVRTLKGTR
jgi:hypothetical protein